MSKPVYFIKIKMKNNKKANDFCIENNIIGIGWGLKSGIPKTLDEYEHLKITNNEYSNESSLTRTINAFKDLDSNGGFIWTKDNYNQFYLCIPNGKYKYCAHESKYASLGIAQYIPCKFYKIGSETLVPKEILEKMDTKGVTKEVTDENSIKITQAIYDIIANLEREIT